MRTSADTLPVNRCDHSPRVIASHLFNRNPLPIEIQGVRRAHRSLFARLDRLEDPKARERAFREYMALVFQVGKWRKESSPLGRRSLRNSYLRFLRGWMQDASSPEGAVLKGWVESRFGLFPAFHAGLIANLHAPAYVLYLVERMRESARSNAVEAQFDLLFEFVQYELRRRHPGVPAFTLYRGVKNLGDYRVTGEAAGNRVVLRLNNLNSFTSRLEHAWEFGSRVLVAEVPASKIFFRSDLLPGILPRGEEEALVIGGEYEVTVRLY
ncbi:MAG: N-acyl homoserine lactonase [Deltaproteobacteria bacterium]|nr:N-acyl homoserine lactonase [Deltaproteobacteria bacterium]